MTSRLPILAALCLPLLAARPAAAFGEPSAFTFAVIRHSGNYNPRPSGLRRISWELAKRTSVGVKLDPKEIDLTDPDLFHYPVLVLAGDGDFNPFNDAEREALRRHLTFGGFLFVDDGSARPGGAFDVAARREIKAILPNAPIGHVPKEHVLYRSFFRLDAPTGRVDAAQDADAVVMQGRIAVLFSPNDVEGAIAKDQFGNWEMEVSSGSDHQRELAFRFGINIVMYALCLDYKDDQVHIEYLKSKKFRRL